MGRWIDILRDDSLGRRMKERPDLVVVGLALLYFVVRLTCYAFWLDDFVPPDEVDWFSRVRFFSKVVLIPEDTTETAASGLIAHRPFLYFWVMGKLLPLNCFAIDDLIFIRLANIPLAVATVIYGYRISGLFTDSRLARVVVVVVLSNTLQFSTLSASVTYDNLATLLGVIGCFYSLRLFSEWRTDTLLGLLLVLALGCLTKITFLPIAAILVVALVIRRRKTIASDLADSTRALRHPSKRQIALLIPLLLSVALCAEMFGGNLIRYGTIDAHAEKVLPLEDAMRHRIVRRDLVVSAFKNGDLTYEQAVAEAEKIQNKGNRNRALGVLELLREPERLEAARVGRDSYAFIWTQIMIDRIVGYQGNGDRVMPLSRPASYLVLAMVIGCLLMFVRKARSSDADGVPVYAFWICFAFAMLLMWGITYPLYVDYGTIDRTVNGRHLFPLLPLLYCIGARYGLTYLSRRFQVAIAVAVCIFFLCSDFPFFVANLSRCWFQGAEAYPECVW